MKLQHFLKAVSALHNVAITVLVPFQVYEAVAPSNPKSFQFVIFKPISYCFEETIGFDVETSFASRPVSRLIR